jgi:MFS family permease
MVTIYPFQEMAASIWYSFITGLPGLLWAVIALLIGFLAGKLGGWLVKQFLVKIKLDQYIFEKEKFKMKLSDIFSVLTRWIIYLLFILVSVKTLDISELTNLIEKAIGFLAGIVEASVIIIVGYSIAYYIKEKVMHSKTFYAEVVGNVIFFLTLYVSIALALPFIGIDTQLINWILIVILASFGLGIGLALGLGLKDTVNTMAKEYTKKLGRRRK